MASQSERENELWLLVTKLNASVKESLEKLRTTEFIKDFKNLSEEDFVSIIDRLVEAGERVTALGRTTSIFQLTLEDETAGRHGIGLLIRGIKQLYVECINEFLSLIGSFKLKTKFNQLHPDFESK